MQSPEIHRAKAVSYTHLDVYKRQDEYQRIERWKAGAPECTAAIHDAGGKAVLAHPCQLGCSHGRLEEILLSLIHI